MSSKAYAALSFLFLEMEKRPVFMAVKNVLLSDLRLNNDGGNFYVYFTSSKEERLQVIHKNEHLKTIWERSNQAQI